jgi:Na+/H+-dicarboxylate symporter
MPPFGAFLIVKRFSFSPQLLLGLVLGVALGFAARIWDLAWLATTLTEVGAIFVQLLKLAVPPLVFAAVVVSVANLRNVNGAARLAGKTLFWFLATALIAVIVGIVLGLIINPGQGVP